jgi:hypothetical protein
MVPPSITGTTYRITTDSTDSTTFWIGFKHLISRIVKDMIMRDNYSFARPHTPAPARTVLGIHCPQPKTARRLLLPISPQRRTLGDLVVRRTVRVDRR